MSGWRYPAKQLIRYVSTHGKPIRAHRKTLDVARFLLQDAPLAELLHEKDDLSSDFYFLSEKYESPERAFGKDTILGPREHWEEIWRMESSIRLAGLVVRALDLKLPWRIEERVVRPDRIIIVYRRKFDTTGSSQTPSGG